MCVHPRKLGPRSERFTNTGSFVTVRHIFSRRMEKKKKRGRDHWYNYISHVSRVNSKLIHRVSGPATDESIVPLSYSLHATLFAPSVSLNESLFGNYVSFVSTFASIIFFILPFDVDRPIGSRIMKRVCMAKVRSLVSILLFYFFFFLLLLLLLFSPPSRFAFVSL